MDAGFSAQTETDTDGHTVDHGAPTKTGKDMHMKDKEKHGPIRRAANAFRWFLTDIKQLLAMPIILTIYLALLVIDHQEKAKEAREERKERERNGYGRQDEDTLRTTL